MSALYAFFLCSHSMILRLLSLQYKKNFLHLCPDKKHTMMKKHALLGLAALISVLTSCGGNTASESRLHVIFDNPAPRTMPVSLFGEVPDELVSSLGIADGIPSSVSVMLLEKDGQQLLFDAGNGNDDSQMLPQLQAVPSASLASALRARSRQTL